MKETNIICDNCESEFDLEIIHSENDITFCPFCGECLDNDIDIDIELDDI